MGEQNGKPPQIKRLPATRPGDKVLHEGMVRTVESLFCRMVTPNRVEPWEVTLTGVSGEIPLKSLQSAKADPDWEQQLLVKTGEILFQTGLDRSHCGWRYRAARLNAGISQAELARRLGVSQARVSAIENGSVSPTPKLAVDYANALALHPFPLILGEDRKDLLNFLDDWIEPGMGDDAVFLLAVFLHGTSAYGLSAVTGVDVGQCVDWLLRLKRQDLLTHRGLQCDHWFIDGGAIAFVVDLCVMTEKVDREVRDGEVWFTSRVYEGPKKANHLRLAG